MMEDENDVDEAATSQAVACLIEVSRRLRDDRLSLHEPYDEMAADEPTVH